MGMTRIALRSLAREDDTRPFRRFSDSLNGFLLESELMGDRFAPCASYASRSPTRNGLDRVSGWASPPLVVRADASLDAVGRPGSLLGLFEDISLYEAHAELGRGDAIALFTDGLTELSVERPDEGEAMLRSALVAAAGEEAAGIIKTERTCSILGELRDDAALVVAKRL